MAITIKDIADMFGKDVFTSKGVYCGKVSDVEFDLSKFKIRSLVIEVSRESVLGKMVGGRKGVIVPYSAVQAIGDIAIIKHVSAPMPEEEVPVETEEK
jgi:sporulation protein YlmC with PRC-barrel domain